MQTFHFLPERVYNQTARMTVAKLQCAPVSPTRGFSDSEEDREGGAQRPEEEEVGALKDQNRKRLKTGTGAGYTAGHL